MARPRTSFVCGACGASTPSWRGRCPGCGEWNTLDEQVVAPEAAIRDGGSSRSVAVPIQEVEADGAPAIPTGVGELDRVLGGGLVLGSVTLVGGEPGVGKSTLLLQAGASVAEAGGRVLYVTAEESAAQVRRRAERLGLLPGSLFLVAESSLAGVFEHVRAVAPDLLIVDSIQTVFDPEHGSAPGTVAQVRGAAARFTAHARTTGLTTVLVGHVTKEGSLAGPRVLEHLVDTVLGFEGDRQHSLRLLHVDKHRFGSTRELGVFEMTGGGLVDVADPSALFLADRRPGLAGSAVVPVLEGHRPLLIEVQALVVPSTIATPRRSAQGIDAGRVGLLLAVLERHADMPFGACDVYALAVGGARISEPAADLGIVAALASARTGVAVPPDVVLCAEVGLSGELRRVARVEQRLSEAARLGFGSAVVPSGAAPTVGGLDILRADDVGMALAVLGQCRAVPGRAGLRRSLATRSGSPAA